MAQALKLDRRAKAALTALALLVLAILVLSIRSAVVAVTADTLSAAPTAQSQDEIVQLGSLTVLVRKHSVGSRLAHWVQGGSRGAHAFEIADDLFIPGSDALAPEGEAKVGTFSLMMKDVKTIDAQILVSASSANPGLAQRRAQRLRDDVIRSGVAATRVEVAEKPIKAGDAASAKPELIVVLSS